MSFARKFSFHSEEIGAASKTFFTLPAISGQSLLSKEILHLPFTRQPVEVIYWMIYSTICKLRAKRPKAKERNYSLLGNVILMHVYLGL